MYRNNVSVLGGREAGHAYIKIPADIASELEGQYAELQVDFNGSAVTLYTKGHTGSRAFPKHDSSAVGCFASFSADTTPT